MSMFRRRKTAETPDEAADPAAGPESADAGRPAGDAVAAEPGRPQGPWDLADAPQDGV